MALSPLFFFCLFYLSCGIISGDFYSTPITIAFMLTCIYAVLATRNASMEQRIEMLSKGAGQPNIMLMIWIFILAGAFAASAKQMGAIDATVNLAINALPGNMILAGIFLASCFISLSMGTSVGTIAALIPIAQGIASQTDIPLAMMVGIVVGGAYFGDNLSFISDTTIMATRTQGCRMRDKFIVNSKIVIPAAVIVLVLYIFMGLNTHVSEQSRTVDFWLVLPYLTVLATALIGINVMVVLIIGLLMTALVGMGFGHLNAFELINAMGQGVMNMAELIIVTLLAGGLMELVRHNGGIAFIVERMSRHIHSTRMGELSIAFLVFLTNLCTANNTIAILTVGPIAKEISDQCGIDPRRSASILDTFSCLAQSLVPYGAQLLIASGLAEVNPVGIIPYLYYPFVMGACALFAILVPLHHRKS
ncbi:MAG: Na+/H+ antiporter NhaC family protein [Bacteroidaceae bacterium]|nr:Na+/H+ antiporter NhaC family protein [Bacteroidaceae bacterium]